MVGAGGFEPTTNGLRGHCSTTELRTLDLPPADGVPGGIQTPNLVVRSHALCSVELRGQYRSDYIIKLFKFPVGKRAEAVLRTKEPIKINTANLFADPKNI